MIVAYSFQLGHASGVLQHESLMRFFGIFVLVILGFTAPTHGHESLPYAYDTARNYLDERVKEKPQKQCHFQTFLETIENIQLGVPYHVVERTYLRGISKHFSASWWFRNGGELRILDLAYLIEARDYDAYGTWSIFAEEYKSLIEEGMPSEIIKQIQYAVIACEYAYSTIFNRNH